MNKQFRILVLLCCALALASLGLGLEYAQARKEIQRLKHEKGVLEVSVYNAKKRQKIAEGLACRGDAPPLSDGELFASGMQDYWKRQVKMVWKLRKENPVTRANCRPSADGCYPWKVSEYATTEQLRTGLRKIIGYYPKDEWLHRLHRPDELYYETIVREVLHGTVNHPETERMYQPEHADGSANFGVLHNEGAWIEWYGAGCCRLMTHAEAMAEALELKHREGYVGMTEGPYETAADVPSGKNLNDFRYLRIQTCTADSNIKPGTSGVNYLQGDRVMDCTKSGARYRTMYYLLSSCGELLFW